MLPRHWASPSERSIMSEVVHRPPASAESQGHVCLIEAIDLPLRTHTHREGARRSKKDRVVPSETPLDALDHYERCWRIVGLVLDEYIKAGYDLGWRICMRWNRTGLSQLPLIWIPTA